jgi:PPOX class probable F420-dependent enzyme
MNEQQAREFVARSTRAVIATIKRDGRPQLSNISYTLDDDGLIKISVTRDRAKTRNLLRDPRVSLAVLGDSWYEYLVVEGTSEVRDGDGVLAELRHVYQRIAGKPHSNWDEFDAAMVAEGRVILAITIERMYPLDR